MAEETPIIGGEEPRKPTHSLPRYSEPTPETHRKLSREEEAELALKHTVYTPGTRSLLIALFLLTSSRRRLPTPWRRSRFLRVNTPTASVVPPTSPCPKRDQSDWP